MIIGIILPGEHPEEEEEPKNIPEEKCPTYYNLCCDDCGEAVEYNELSPTNIDGRTLLVCQKCKI
jgi:hypothetical protein